MKILLIGDCHIKINKFQLGLQFLAWLDQLIADQKPDLVVNLGDFFDTHAVVRSEVMTEFMKHVNGVLKQGIPYVYLLGNHDMYRPNDSKYHALRHLVGAIPNFYIVDEIQELFNCTFVPYQHDPSNFPTITKELCIAHQTFRGADFGHILAKDGVDADGIKGCQLIVSGHIHKKSVLGPVLYVGSPFSQSANDVDQVKGITILDTDNFNTSFYECPLPMWRRCTALLDETFSATLGSDIARFPNDHWLLELSGPKPEVLAYLSSDDYKTIIANIDIKVKTLFTDKEKKKVSIEARSMSTIVADYVNKVYSGNIDKNALIEAATKVLNSI